MSIFSKIGHAIAAPFKGAAHLVKDPVGWAENIGHQATDPKTLLSLAGAAAIPGLGGVLGSIPGIGGALSAGAGAIGSAEGAIGGALGKIPGVSSLEGVLGLGGGAAGAIPDSALGIGGGGTSLSSILGGAGKFLTGNGGKNALGLAQGISGILDQKKSENYGKDALGAATGAYNAAAPLRAQGLAGLTNPGALPNTAGLSQIAGTLQQPDASKNAALQSQLAQLKAPSPVGVSQFTAPQRPTRAPMPADPGNPYARAS